MLLWQNRPKCELLLRLLFLNICSYSDRSRNKMSTLGPEKEVDPKNPECRRSTAEEEHETCNWASQSNSNQSGWNWSSAAFTEPNTKLYLFHDHIIKFFMIRCQNQAQFEAKWKCDYIKIKVFMWKWNNCFAQKYLHSKVCDHVPACLFVR